MRIEHIAIWVDDLEVMRRFYAGYFNARSGPLYHNLKTGLQSYFLSLSDGARIELMKRPDIQSVSDRTTEKQGYAHLAISVRGHQGVDTLYQKMQAEGVRIVAAPRVTGDGYYEFVCQDPEKNRVEVIVS